MSSFEKIQQNDLAWNPKVDKMGVFLEFLEVGFSFLFYFNDIL
jgi:hypothetical protein